MILLASCNGYPTIVKYLIDIYKNNITNNEDDFDILHMLAYGNFKCISLLIDESIIEPKDEYEHFTRVKGFKKIANYIKLKKMESSVTLSCWKNILDMKN